MQSQHRGGDTRTNGRLVFLKCGEKANFRKKQLWNQVFFFSKEYDLHRVQSLEIPLFQIDAVSVNYWLTKFIISNYHLLPIKLFIVTCFSCFINMQIKKIRIRVWSRFKHGRVWKQVFHWVSKPIHLTRIRCSGWVRAVSIINDLFNSISAFI